MFHITPLTTFFLFFFFNDTATTEIYTLSLHDALPISWDPDPAGINYTVITRMTAISSEDSAEPLIRVMALHALAYCRSEEHTSELQSQSNLVCRLLLEKKKNKQNNAHITTLSDIRSQR